jgi:Mn2+/Fe2+ NRAMP family transporter
VASSVLGQTGEGADSIAGLAKVFEPLAGPIGGFVFALGFFGAAFSSMITNAMAGGTLLSDAFGRGASASTSVARIAAGVILAWGVGITLVFQSSPVQLIVIAQALTVFIAPILAIIIVIMANRRSLMHEMTNTWWQNLFGVLGIAAVLALSIRLAVSLWG